MAFLKYRHVEPHQAAAIASRVRFVNGELKREEMKCAGVWFTRYYSGSSTVLMYRAGHGTVAWYAPLHAV